MLTPRTISRGSTKSTWEALHRDGRITRELADDYMRGQGDSRRFALFVVDNDQGNTVGLIPITTFKRVCCKVLREMEAGESVSISRSGEVIHLRRVDDVCFNGGMANGVALDEFLGG